MRLMLSKNRRGVCGQDGRDTIFVDAKAHASSQARVVAPKPHLVCPDALQHVFLPGLLRIHGVLSN